jgi:hypothetical protein
LTLDALATMVLFMKRKKKLNGRGCRKKGHDFERWVAKELQGLFPEARRHLEYQSREANGVDIVNTQPYLFQCKRGRRYASLSTIKEIQICPIEGGIPVLVTKGDNEEPLACIPWVKFKRLLYLEKKILTLKSSRLR